MSSYSLEDKRRYAAWLEMPPAARRAARLPDNKEDYARSHGMQSRTLRRWEGEPKFDELRAEERGRWDGVEVPEAPTPRADETDAAKADYERVRTQLVARALEGDPKAMAEFMRYWGSAYAQEELAQRNRGLSEVDDETLVSETLALIGREQVEAWLIATA